MLYPIIFAIITSLSVSLAVSGFKVTSESYVNNFKEPKFKTFYYQEKMTKEAVDSFCRDNFYDCFTEDQNLTTVSFDQIDPYLPRFFNNGISTDFFNRLEIDYETFTITLTHKISSENRNKYVYDSVNLDSNLTCENGSDLPCNSDLIQNNFKVSEELKTLYIKKFIIDLEASKDEAETEEDNATIDAKIDVNLDLLDDLNTTINERPLKGFL